MSPFKQSRQLRGKPAVNYIYIKKMVEEITEILRTQENVFTIEVSCKGRLCFKRMRGKGRGAETPCALQASFSVRTEEKRWLGDRLLCIFVNENTSLPLGLTKGFFSGSTLLASSPRLSSFPPCPGDLRNQIGKIGEQLDVLSSAYPRLLRTGLWWQLFLFFHVGFPMWEATLNSDGW